MVWLGDLCIIFSGYTIYVYLHALKIIPFYSSVDSLCNITKLWSYNRCCGDSAA